MSPMLAGVLGAALFAAAGHAMAAGVTAAEKLACTPDALRHCAAAIPDAAKVAACMVAHQAQLGPSCRAVFDRHAPKRRTTIARASKKMTVPVPAHRPIAAPTVIVVAPEPTAIKLPVTPPAPIVVTEFAPIDVVPVPAITPTKSKGKTAMQALKDLFVGLSWPALILIGLGIWYVAKHGVPAAAAKATALAAKISALWNGGVADVKAVQTALAGEVAVIKADIATIKNHVGIPTPGA